MKSNKKTRNQTQKLIQPNRKKQSNDCGKILKEDQSREVRWLIDLNQITQQQAFKVTTLLTLDQLIMIFEKLKYIDQDLFSIKPMKIQEINLVMNVWNSLRNESQDSNQDIYYVNRPYGYISNTGEFKLRFINELDEIKKAYQPFISFQKLNLGSIKERSQKVKSDKKQIFRKYWTIKDNDSAEEAKLAQIE
ncbi:UNKNOWN [Stylonychia lemnae]|uniref:Uncharacterized protein n=1 Tax=Stylonychia lemnae TaxID=5949 RepID=A0A078B4R6_STYLE|nr:UNKNOWN [Stylonychia lemnae]|eukprot:CDW89256.1 UNKNOWN [Stylonychia lemnae]